MSDFENEVNVKDLKFQLFNYLINYLIEKRKNRIAKSVTLHINPNVYSEFLQTLSQLGYSQYQNSGLLVEAFMKFFVENYKPKGMIQTTLFYKPQINVLQNVEVNIAEKLELKLVKRDLTSILNALENALKTRQDYFDFNFYINRLHKALTKALNVYEKNRDQELELLLQKAEKFIKSLNF